EERLRREGPAGCGDRPIDGLVRDQDAGEELEMDLDSRVAAHRPEDERRPAVPEGHPRGERVDGTGTTPVGRGRVVGATIVQQHAGTGHHDAAPEGNVEALAQADRHAVLVDDAEIDRVAAGTRGPKRTDQPEVELGATRVEPLERLQTRDRLQDEVAAAVGW